MLIFSHYNIYRQNIDLYNFKKIYKQNKIKIINKIEKNLIIRSLIYFLSIYIYNNNYNVFSCELNIKFKFSNLKSFYENDFTEFSDFLFFYR